MAERNLRKEKIGVVVSDKMDKTVIVKISRQIVHPMFGKIVRLNKKYVAHDAKDECKMGDVVSIVETRPLSKTKRWRVESIITKAK
ncbi:MAG TPA: 30S ribosomal protein S17 [Fibrobacteres bacterium]|jgi:small subunit ribosomal protein S17|nr:30S ribosomal protein S17 [Fibrobacterota bacterium]